MLEGKLVRTNRILIFTSMYTRGILVYPCHTYPATLFLASLVVSRAVLLRQHTVAAVCQK